jgi:hypothetical protein
MLSRPLRNLDSFYCGLARDLFTSVFEHWPYLLFLPNEAFQAVIRIADKLNRAVLEDVFWGFDALLAEVIQSYPACKIGRFMRQFSSSTDRYVFADLYDILCGEGRPAQQRRLGAIWKRAFAQLADMEGEEQIEAALTLICGPPRDGEVVNAQTLCEVIDLLKELHYLTTPFWRFHSDEKEVTRRRPEVEVVAKYEAFVQNLTDGHAKIAEMLSDIRLKFTLELTLEEVRAAMQAAKAKNDLHRVQPMPWPPKEWTTRVPDCE